MAFLKNSCASLPCCPGGAAVRKATPSLRTSTAKSAVCVRGNFRRTAPVVARGHPSRVTSARRSARDSAHVSVVPRRTWLKDARRHQMYADRCRWTVIGPPTYGGSFAKAGCSATPVAKAQLCERGTALMGAGSASVPVLISACRNGMDGPSASIPTPTSSGHNRCTPLKRHWLQKVWRRPASRRRVGSPAPSPAASRPRCTSRWPWRWPACGRKAR